MNILNKKFLNFFLVLIGTFIFTCVQPALGGKQIDPVGIQFPAKDGFMLSGTIDMPANKSIAHKVPLVIFLHSLGGSRIDWYGYPERIKALGVATLTMDLRGHGKSIINKKGQRRYWPTFKNTEFQKYPDDIISAIKYVKQQYPEINASKIAIIGADISANATVIAASRNNRIIKTIILLSPSLSYKGLEARIPLVSYGKNPVFIMVSRRDVVFYESSSELVKYAQGYKVLKVFPSGGEGLDILKFQPQARDMVVNWIKNYLLK